MNLSQLKNSGFLFLGQTVIKLANLAKQVILAFFLGVSSDIDLLLAAQIVPTILAAMVSGGAGEVLITNIRSKNEDNIRLVVLFSFCIGLMTIIWGGLYLFSVPVWLNVFSVSDIKAELFWTLSFIIVANKLPAAFVSTFSNLLYYQNKYRYFVFTSLISEVIGIVVVLIMVKSWGIVAFAWGLGVTSLVNAVLFFNLNGLSISVLFKIEEWKSEWSTLIDLLRKVLSLGLQTLVNHLSTFTERALCMRYLAPGYLSSLNYSKSLSEMPRMVMLSSILTTTYVEQAKKKNESIDDFTNYSSRMEGVLNKLSFAFQILSIVFAPLILVLLFRRGRFDNESVESTLIIYQILTVGFVPGLMMSFFSRTMYIVSKYRQLFYFILAKFAFEVILMISLLKAFPHSIPTALAAGKFFISIGLFVYLNSQFPNMFNKRRFAIIYLLLITISLTVLYVNQLLISHFLDKSTFDLFLVYSPLLLVFGLGFLVYLYKLGYLLPILKKFRK